MPPASSPCQLRFACWNSGKLPALLITWRSIEIAL
ncbi:hypothetical protein SLEP1_g28665 [Rubroshorea leprosula]|uniref:Uncharacterized protein n=1 Tax=Rubroshorea leprosula TaxID=152421 RepID=A0AAV5K1I3_9ROSI|nr:hypothetical protein SLEP1_g28665 [Rubroshorea leprosula]